MSLYGILGSVYRESEAVAAATTAQNAERFDVEGGRIRRRVALRNGTFFRTDMGAAPRGIQSEAALRAAADSWYLKSAALPETKDPVGIVTIADLFCGIGALSLGAFEAARAIGYTASVTAAADADAVPLSVYRSTFGVDSRVAQQKDLGKSLRRSRGPRTKAEIKFLGEKRREPDILLAGPPCQGHSRLNNHTRHDDPRNDLYLQVARFAELEQPRLCIVENVDSIVHDMRQSATTTRRRLEAMGYSVDESRVLMHDLGVPQRRRRHVLVATRGGEPRIDLSLTLDAYAVTSPAARDLKWAIGDLEGKATDEGFDSASKPSAANRKRIRWLHTKPTRFDLPNSKRPSCHRDPKVDGNGVPHLHSYKSMYGKLNWRKPAQTITSGFGSMGQGRYVHPSEERTLTPHEAARLQFVPDFVRFDAVAGRGQWARLIGNVAPMKLSYVIALEFLR